MSVKRELDRIGIRHGTDKTFLRQNYLSHYERLVKPFRNQTINLIEIGVLEGGSLRTWRDFLPNATVVGIDIQPRCLQHAGERIVVRVGSQTDTVFLSTICDEYPPSIVIDDGSHIAEHQVRSFEHLFPRLLPGGCYIIEDLAFQVSPATAAQHRGELPFTAIEYFLQYGEGLMGLRPRGDGRVPVRDDIAQGIDRIELFANAAAIWKRIRIDNADLWELAESVLSEGAPPASWWYYHQFLMSTRGPVDRAEAALDRARRELPDWLNHFARSKIREREGDWHGQVEELRRAVEHAGTNAEAGRIRQELEKLLVQGAPSAAHRS